MVDEPSPDVTSNNTFLLAQTIGNNAITTRDTVQRELRNDHRRSVWTRFEDVADGATASLHVKNPADSGTDMRVAVLQGTAGGSANLDVYDNPTIDDPGTEINPKNDRVGNPIDNLLEVGKNGSYSDLETTPRELFIPGGIGPRAVGTSFASGVFEYPEGSAQLFELTNISGNPATYGINIVFSEVHDE